MELILALAVLIAIVVALVFAAAEGFAFVMRAFGVHIRLPWRLTVGAVVVLGLLVLWASSLPVGLAPGPPVGEPLPTPYPRPTPYRIPTPYPETTPTPAPTPGLAEIVKQQLARLTLGQLAFNPPRSVVMGDVTRIEARIAQTIGDPGLTKGMGGPGIPQVQVVRVSTFMGAELSGENFEIKALADASQIVEESRPTQWAWDVKATKLGKQMLHLKVWARILAPPLPEQVKDLPVLDREIDVQVNPVYSATQFWENNWQWVLGSGFSASAVAVVWKLRERFLSSVDGRPVKRRSQVRPRR